MTLPNTPNSSVAIPFATWVDKLIQTLAIGRYSAANGSLRTLAWGWTATTLLDLMDEYPSGLTRPIILAELESRWEEALEDLTGATLSKKYSSLAGLLDGLTTQHSLFDVTICRVGKLPQTQVWMLTFQESHSNTSVEAYLHQKFYFLAESSGHHQILLQTPRQIRFSGAQVVRKAGQISRLLPTPLMLFELSEHALEYVISLYRQLGVTSQSLLSQTNPNTQTGMDARVKADISFLRAYFISHALADVTPEALACNRDFYLLVKVHQIHIGDATPREGHLKRALVYLTDVVIGAHSRSDLAVLILWDEQITLASMLKKGDRLAIYLPRINSPHVRLSEDTVEDCVFEMEYGARTVLFLIPNSASGLSKNNLLSQINTQTTDEDGAIECKLWPSRLRIADLQPAMSGVTLLGQVVAVSSNLPVTKQNKVMDRFALRLADDSGNCDLTCWDELGLQAAQCQPGEWVLLDNLTTTTVSEFARGNTPFFINVSSIFQSRIRTITTRRGFLSCSDLRQPVPLVSVPFHPYSICWATVVGWRRCDYTQSNQYIHPPKDHLGVVVYVHPPCQHSVGLTGENYRCQVCAITLPTHSPLNLQYRIVWRIDDGTALYDVEAQWHASNDIVGLAASDFSQQLPYQQSYLLNSVVGKTLYFLLLNLTQNLASQRNTPQSVSPFIITAASAPDGIMADVKTLCKELTLQ
ncbi:hypothetical protein IWQ61_009198 [Dispira simplex]|nr:hypothetical protein IWQ61_009198 [Dispira simplex]